MAGWAAVEGNAGAKYFNGDDPSITGMPNGSSQLIVDQGTTATSTSTSANANGQLAGLEADRRPATVPRIYNGSAVIASLPNGSSQIFTTTVNSNATWENTRASSGVWSGWTLLNGYQTAVAAAGWGGLG